MTHLIKQINLRIDRWLLAPEPHAAGNLGLFRIIFCLFYLWYLSSNFAIFLKYLNSDHYGHRLLMTEFFPIQWVTLFLPLIESVLVMALVVLLIGFHVRIATAVTLVLGCLLEGFYSTIDYEKAMVFMVFYIPLFMVIDNRWGDTYSLDATLRARKTQKVVDPSSSDGNYFVAARAILVILSALFLSSAIFKFLGTWLSFPELIADLFMSRKVEAALYGLPANPLANFVIQTPIAYHSMRLFTLGFEAVFFLGLFSRKIRHCFIAIALIFHSINALWLIVSFTPVLIVYLIFFDLQSIREKLWPHSINLLKNIPANYLQMGTLALAVMIGILWNSNIDIRSLINVGGMLNWRTIWYPVLPLAVMGLLTTLINLFSHWQSPMTGSQDIV